MITELWESLPAEERAFYRQVFMGRLKRVYHINFFNRLSDSEIIREIWFKQFMEAYNSDSKRLGEKVEYIDRGDTGFTAAFDLPDWAAN